VTKQEVSIGAVTYEAKKKRQNLLRNLHRRKKIFFFIYDVIVKQNLKKKALPITTQILICSSVCVSVCGRERESVCVCVCVSEKESTSSLFWSRFSANVLLICVANVLLMCC